MKPYQAYMIEQKVSRLGMTDAQLMDIAKTIAHNKALISLAHLSQHESNLLIIELDHIERTVKA